MSQHNLPTTATTDLDSVKNHFKIWHETLKKWNEKIPDELILSAGSLIGSYSFNEISSSLRLNQTDFKKRLQKLNYTIESPRHLEQLEFVELPPLTRQHSIHDCTIEIEKYKKAKMTIHFTSASSNDILNIVQSFWEN
jgi:hypothetical protein